MAILKCKMCGGNIQTTDNTYGTCDSCGSVMTLPRAVDEQIVNLFNRANHFRRSNEFDRAIAAYESILNMDMSSAEAHWGLLLSKYGIEYVEDPTSHKRIPTCHRVQSEAILTDPDYLAALENAENAYTKSLYEEEASQIAEIQKGILAVSSREEPYHVFICYKETTESGSRSKDSTIAQDIYYQLTNEGYKVFFARITLEDRLGLQYEPYIFAALNSAKVMIVLGTKPGHFNSVWVKNEWSRFLAIQKKDRNRLLIPCYCDMDAYDLPEELSLLQSQDMTKIGFIQDLIRGIKKVVDANSERVTTTTIVSDQAVIAPGVESLYKRGVILLNDGDWQTADKYFERVLDIDPEYAQAYVGKLCVELRVNNEEALLERNEIFSNYKNYKNALRFAKDSYRDTLESYARTNEKITIAMEREREREREAKKREMEQLYQNALSRYNEFFAKKKNSISDSKALIAYFLSLGDYRDAAQMAQRIKQLAIPMIDGSSLICSKCGAKQQKSRTSCWRCGIEFLNDSV